MWVLWVCVCESCSWGMYYIHHMMLITPMSIHLNRIECNHPSCRAPHTALATNNFAHNLSNWSLVTISRWLVLFPSHTVAGVKWENFSCAYFPCAWFCYIRATVLIPITYCLLQFIRSHRSMPLLLCETCIRTDYASRYCFLSAMFATYIGNGINYNQNFRQTCVVCVCFCVSRWHEWWRTKFKVRSTQHFSVWLVLVIEHLQANNKWLRLPDFVRVLCHTRFWHFSVQIVYRIACCNYL